MNESLGFAHFLSQSDAVGRIVLFLLLALSVASWYLILTKGLANLLAGRRASVFLRQFWSAASLDEVKDMLGRRMPTTPSPTSRARRWKPPTRGAPRACSASPRPAARASSSRAC
jgi:biopolymer transport protein ExbB/TolQ